MKVKEKDLYFLNHSLTRMKLIQTDFIMKICQANNLYCMKLKLDKVNNTKNSFKNI